MPFILRKLSALVLLIIPIASAAADDWPHWRGPQRNDISREQSGWKPGGQWPGPELWKTNVGDGSTSPLVIDGKLYTLGWRDGRDHLVCLAAGSGEELWHADYPAPRHARHSTGDEGLYAGPTATPEYDPETGVLYTLGADGELQAWNTRDAGKRLWRLNLYDEYRVPQRPRVTRTGGLRDYGYTTAPLLLGQQLLVEVGDDSGNVIAFDKQTGKQLWTSENKDPAGHTGGPVPLEVEGLPCVAVLTIYHLVVMRVNVEQAGKTIAEYEWKTDFANSIASPAVSGSSVIITSNYNQNAIVRLDITLQGATEKWKQPFASKVCTPIIHGDKLYWAWQRLRCHDFATGKPVWDGGDFADAGSCILTADDRLIVWGRNGRLVLAETATRSPQAYRELARQDGIFRTDVWPHIVLADGRLYCKDWRGNLRCFAVGE